MIDEVVSKSEIQRYLSAIREQIATGDLDVRAVGQAIGANDEHAATEVLSRMHDPANLTQSSGGDAPGMPFIARDPITSLLQSALDMKFREKGMVQERPRVAGRVGPAEESVVREEPGKRGPSDPEWVKEIVTATLAPVLEHHNRSYEFNPKPAEHEITSPDLRVVVVGDWGSGKEYCADVVAAMMSKQVEQAGQRSVAVIHLGDVYYSGNEDEYKSNVIADGFWPVSTAQAQAGVTSWSLNGNHDIYSGSWAYFVNLLAGDPRFANQRSPDGKPTSFFRLRTPKWDLVGLDTAWHPEILPRGSSQAEEGVLEDPQATQVATWADDAEKSGRALMLLTHHQFLSAFDQLGTHSVDGCHVATKLNDQLEEVLAAARVRAWLWGHEHRCVGFKDFTTQKGIGIAYPRCLGHGGWYQSPPTNWKCPPGVKFFPQETDTDGYLRRGFAVLDFAADGTIAVTYHDDYDQLSPPPETFTPA